MKKCVLIAGGKGLVGMDLSEKLLEKGFEVIHLSRKQDLTARFPAYKWDIEQNFLEEEAIKKANIIINLAGEGIADGRWTAARKKKIMDSRTNSALLIANVCQKLNKKIEVYISAGAIGFYGNRPQNENLEETNAAGSGFLSESCVAWEKAVFDASKILNCRTAIFRIGIVLSSKGGALGKMLPSYPFGIGTYFGDGSMIYSWIHIEDMVNLCLEAIENKNIEGIYNAVAPYPESMKSLAIGIKNARQKLAFILPIPSFILRIAFGEMADTILSSSFVSSKKIVETGFKFQFPQLQNALNDLIQNKR